VSTVRDTKESGSATGRGRSTEGSSGPRRPSGVYRLHDTTWRVSESAEGGLKVEVLTDGAWIMGPVNLVGLRLDASTTRLTRAAIDALPE
jgi:hypothetical protein